MRTAITAEPEKEAIVATSMVDISATVVPQRKSKRRAQRKQDAEQSAAAPPTPEKVETLYLQQTVSSPPRKRPARRTPQPAQPVEADTVAALPAQASDNVCRYSVDLYTAKYCTLRNIVQWLLRFTIQDLGQSSAFSQAPSQHLACQLHELKPRRHSTSYTDRQGTPNGQRSKAIRRARHIHTTTAFLHAALCVGAGAHGPPCTLEQASQSTLRTTIQSGVCQQCVTSSSLSTWFWMAHSVACRGAASSTSVVCSGLHICMHPRCARHGKGAPVCLRRCCRSSLQRHACCSSA